MAMTSLRQTESLNPSSFMKLPVLRLTAVAAALLACATSARLSAVAYDLTTAGSSALVNGALFQTTTISSTGTGVISPFLRLQGNGSEQGLNSDSANNDLFADTKAGAWTHDVVLADLGIQAGFVGFLLDINQSSANPTLLFDSFKVYTRSGSITDGSQDTLADLNDAILRYDLGANSLLLNYDLNPGSGGGDLLIFLPTSFFQGATLADNLYVVAGFSGANAGFEEFSTFGIERPTPGTFGSPVPENTNVLVLLGAGMIGIFALRRKRTAIAA
jgi:hypothetical protein